MNTFPSFIILYIILHALLVEALLFYIGTLVELVLQKKRGGDAALLTALGHDPKPLLSYWFQVMTCYRSNIFCHD